MKIGLLKTSPPQAHRLSGVTRYIAELDPRLRERGWPLTVFLTPDDRVPFFAGTYFPNEPRHGLPSFRELIQHIAGFLAELVSEAQGVKLLITSRERLHLRGEWVVGVQGMRFPKTGYVSAEALADYSAVRLFLQNATRAKSSFSPKKDEWPALVRICQLLEGMPLGIELAAA